jgi:signal transduction histidine kinase
MITKRPQIILYITILFLILFSCQKKKHTDIVVPKSTKAQVDKLIVIADKLYDKKNFDSAFYYYNEVKSICDPKTKTENYVNAVNRMALIQQNHDDYVGSESTVTKALPYLHYIKNSKYTWNTYIILGTNYLNTYDYKNALLYNNKALQLKTNSFYKSIAKKNIALVLMNQEKYKEALQIFLSLTTKKEMQDNLQKYSSLLDNIGLCYWNLNHPEALSYLFKALEIRLKSKDISGSGTSYIHLSNFYKNINPKLSKKYATLSYEKLSTINNIDDRLSSLKLLINYSSDIELKKYSTKYIELVDSVFEIRQKAKNQFAKIKYNSKTQKDENLKLKTNKAENELQLERQKNRNIFSYIIIAFSLLLILALYFYLTSKGKKEKIEATYKSETRISKKLHDELANDIYQTMAFAENKNLSLADNKEQLLKNLDTIYSRTRNISKDNSVIITNENYVFALKEMLSGFNTPNINLLINGLNDIPWNEIERNKKITIYRVLQELLVNMKKHSKATLAGITFKLKDKNILVNYTDNGQGADLKKMHFKSGLHNIETRIRYIKGEIDIDSIPDKGFKVFIKFPQ